MQIIEISNFEAPELDMFARLNEVQLKNILAPAKEGYFVAESPNVILRALAGGYEPVALLMERSHLDKEGRDLMAVMPQTPVYTADLAVLKNLTGFELTRCVLCAMKRKPLPSVEEILEGARRVAILENVMNPTNVGAIFRSAAALNMDAVLLTPGSADPLYRRAARVSMGTVFQVPWTYIGEETGDWPVKGMEKLRKLGFETASMALLDDTLPLTDPRLKQAKKLAILLGTEGDGLGKETIAASDYTVKIPMSHGVDSLNVAAASAVAFWELSKPE